MAEGTCTRLGWLEKSGSRGSRPFPSPDTWVISGALLWPCHLAPHPSRSCPGLARPWSASSPLCPAFLGTDPPPSQPHYVWNPTQGQSSLRNLPWCLEALQSSLNSPVGLRTLAQSYTINLSWVQFHPHKGLRRWRWSAGPRGYTMRGLLEKLLPYRETTWEFEKLLSMVRRLFTSPIQVVLGIDAYRWGSVELDFLNLSGICCLVWSSQHHGGTKALKAWKHASFYAEPSPAMLLRLETVLSVKQMSHLPQIHTNLY